MSRLNGRIYILGRYTLDPAELNFSFIHGRGPGGQNVNKVSSAVQLRFDVAKSRSLPDLIKNRLLKLAGNRASRRGTIIVEAKRFRSQEHNRRDAVGRLVALIRRAAVPAKRRITGGPPSGSREKRLARKRRRACVKKLRRVP